VAALKAGFVFASSVWFPILDQRGDWTSQNIASILKINMIKNKSIVTKCCRYIKDLRDLRKYTNKKRQIEIDKEINELQKLKEDVKKIRSNF